MDFDYEALRRAIENDPAVTAMCEGIEQQERHDMALLTDAETDSYATLRGKGYTHGDAIWWIRRAASLKLR